MRSRDHAAARRQSSLIDQAQHLVDFYGLKLRPKWTKHTSLRQGRFYFLLVQYRNSFDHFADYALLWVMSEKKPSPETPKGKKENADVPVEKEIGGYENKLEPTRYGDWETNGRCSDF